MVRVKTILDVFSYSAALLGFLPLFPYLGQVPRVAFVAAFIGSIVSERKNLALRGHLPTIVSLAFFLYYLLQFSGQNFVTPAANLLVVLLAVRLASEKTPRHYLQSLALALFALATSSLFSLSAIFLIYLFGMIFIIGAALVVLTFYSVDPATTFTSHGLKKVMAAAFLLPVAALPLMLLFFVILPRTQYPLWNFLNSAVVHTTGLSEKVTPGSAATVGEGKNIAFRAASPPLPPDSLYWRALVFNELEGTNWVRRNPPAGEQGRAVGKETVSQTIYPEPGRTPYVIALNIPKTITGVRTAASVDFVYIRGAGATRRSKYEAVSVVGGFLGARHIDEPYYLSVPDSLSRPFLNLGKEVAGWGSPEEKIARLEEYFRVNKFTYATTGLPTSGDPLHDFLFVSRKGNCEFFASTAALVLRLAGVPTRLVGGYLGGDYSELGRYYVVNEAMAHVWVEAFIQGKGWITVDPSSWSINPSFLRDRGRSGAIHKFQLGLDAMSYYWNVTVINYDLDKQLQLVWNTGSELRRLSAPKAMRTWIMAVLVATVLVAGILGGRRYLTGRRSRRELIFGRLLKKVGKQYGVTLTPDQGLYDLARMVPDPSVRKFVEIYGGIIYHDRILRNEDLRVLEQLVAEVGNPLRDKL